MRIVVCVKHVPDLQADRRFTEQGLVDRSQGDGTLNELDENALEAALQVAEAEGGEVVVVTMGPADAEDAVRRGLQMGADHAIHVVDDGLTGSDAFGTAAVLAAAVQKVAAGAVEGTEPGPVDLVVTGMAALDGLMSVVPTLLAHRLDLPAVTLAGELSVTDGLVRATRGLSHATETVEADLPALVSVTDQANQPRYPNFKGIMAARKKPVTTWSLADLGVDPGTVGLAGARTEVLEAAERPAREDRVLIRDEGDAGVRLVDFLVENRLVPGAQA